MSNALLLDQLDKGIDALLSGANVEVPAADPAVAELLAVADGLCTSVRPDFKAQLKSDLLGPSAPKSNAAVASPIVIATETTRRERPADAMPANPLPTLAGSGYGLYPVQSRSFMASLGAHVLMLALLVTSGIWAAPSLREEPRVTSTVVTDLSHIFPPASDRTRGGGGGDSDTLPGSKGSPPRFDRQQIAPPAIVVRSEQPKLPAESTVVGAPALTFPQTAQIGDPFSHVSGLPSNGTGSREGIGTGERGGVGPGSGPGVGAGWGGGFGNGPYVVGRRVTAPRLIYDPETDYSDEARKQKYQGSVLLQVVVGEDGRARDVRVARSLGLGLDEKTLEAVRQWRFEPGRLEGRAVAVVVNIQVNFRLY